MRRALVLLAIAVSIVVSAGAARGGVSTAFTYDANGNLTSKTLDGVVRSYLYDSRNLLVEVQRDGRLVESYQYDYQGHRVRKSGPGGIVRYVWDGESIVLESDDFGNTIARYEYAEGRLVAIRHVSEGTAFYLFDALGSPVSLSGVDGTLAARYRLGAWGELRSEAGESSNPFLFTAYQFDEATGLYYAKARFYDPELGRFLSEDPFPGGVLEPQSLHRYAYAYANPTAYVDPDGRCVGSYLRQTGFCKAVARRLEQFIGGDPDAQAQREIEIRDKVVQGRREFREQTGRAPRPDEVVWSQAERALTSGFDEIDTSGRIEPDHAEWMAVSAGVGTRMAVSAARAGGATMAEQVAAGLTQLGDEAVGEIVGVSPGDVAALSRYTRGRLSGVAPTPGSAGGSMVVRESADGGTELASISQRQRTVSQAEAPTTTWSRSGAFDDQPVHWTATRPRGTGQTYDVYQRLDVDWTRVRTGGDKRFVGKTNAEAARAGLPPQLDDESFATLHHVGQDARGPLVEASTRYHGVGRSGQRPLHSQYGASQPHPAYPIGRQQFPVDSREYWRWRVSQEAP